MTKRTGRTWGGDIMRGEHQNLERRANGPGRQGDRGGAGRGGLEPAPEATPLGGTSNNSHFDSSPTPNSVSSGLEPNIQSATENSFGGSSIFDPVLAELVYRWFSPAGGRVLDPFAGGSVRGLVASRLGLSYAGIELSTEQVMANERQALRICRAGDRRPVWLNRDAREALGDFDQGIADLILTCPPYGDLEIYSDDPRDISGYSLARFDEALREIIFKACRCLANDRFAIWVVSDYRLADGSYAMLPSKVRFWHAEAGLRLYNEAILLNVAGSLPIRAGKQFQSTRKLGRMHQEILIFLKGDGRRATGAMAPIDMAGIDGALV